MPFIQAISHFLFSLFFSLSLPFYFFPSGQPIESECSGAQTIMESFHQEPGIYRRRMIFDIGINILECDRIFYIFFSCDLYFDIQPKFQMLRNVVFSTHFLSISILLCFFFSTILQHNQLKPKLRIAVEKDRSGVKFPSFPDRSYAHANGNVRSSSTSIGRRKFSMNIIV